MRRGELLILEVQPLLMVLRVEVRVGERNSLSNLMLGDMLWWRIISSDSFVSCSMYIYDEHGSREERGEGEWTRRTENTRVGRGVFG